MTRRTSRITFEAYWNVRWESASAVTNGGEPSCISDGCGKLHGAIPSYLECVSGMYGYYIDLHSIDTTFYCVRMALTLSAFVWRMGWLDRSDGLVLTFRPFDSANVARRAWKNPLYEYPLRILEILTGL